MTERSEGVVERCPLEGMKPVKELS
jgi:hypothetical protein